jgi:hypothetical protein
MYKSEKSFFIKSTLGCWENRRCRQYVCRNKNEEKRRVMRGGEKEKGYRKTNMKTKREK